MLDALMCSQYQLVLRSSRTEPGENKSLAGHEFEEQTPQLVYSHEKTKGLKAHQPRLTLQMPTISGLTYQFDASFTYRDMLFVIECKRRQSLPSGSEHVHHFSSKILDYVLASQRTGNPLRMPGMFISTRDTGEKGSIYGLSFGVRVIDPAHPPLEYMRSTLPKDEVALRSSLEQVESKMNADFIRDKN